MDIKINYDTDGSTLVAKLSGNIDMAAIKPLQYISIEFDKSGPFGTVVLDVKDVGIVTSYFANFLIKFCKTHHFEHTQVIIRNPNEHVLELLEVSQVSSFFKIEQEKGPK